MSLSPPFPSDELSGRSPVVPGFRLGKLQIQSELARLICAQPGIGRADIARVTGMARATVSEHVQPLLALGLLSEKSARYAGRGRPSIGLSLNPRAGMVLVADIGITHIRLVVADLAGRQVVADTGDPDFTVAPDVLLGRVVDQFGALLKQQLLQAIPVHALVVGIPSPVDYARGVPVRPPIMPGWDGFPVATWLRNKLGVPVLVENDVNLMALGEARARPASQSPLLFVKAASGIGCGIITQDGFLHRGADGDAGDIGHIPVQRGANVSCACGNVGCIEAIASVPAITRQIRATKGMPPDEPVDLAALLTAADPVAIRLLREAAAELGDMVALLVNVLNPACIVLGGKMAHLSDDLLSGVRASVYRRAPPLATRRLSIELSRAGREAGVLGGIALGVDNALSEQGLRRMQEKLVAG